MMTSQNYHTELVNNGAFFLEINLVFECHPIVFWNFNVGGIKTSQEKLVVCNAIICNLLEDASFFWISFIIKRYYYTK